MEVMLMKKTAVAAKADDQRVKGEESGREYTEKAMGAKPVSSGDSSKTSPNEADPNISNKDDQLESTRAKMSEVREENERLKTLLAHIVKEYQSLQMHFFDIKKKDDIEAGKKPIEPSALSHADLDQVDVDQEHELVSLSLGSGSSERKKKKEENEGAVNGIKSAEFSEELTLGLDCKTEPTAAADEDHKKEQESSLSPENSSEETNKEENWPPSRALKTVRRPGDDEPAPQAHVKRARVSVRARCDAPTMNDGCQWRKYGQKIAKGNPCPRAYYRCTVAPGCPVRKQVQRCAEDMSILITTYEGTHNHPLPISATAMASTTAAAACMLTSGSSTSGVGPAHSPASAGLNFAADNSRARQFYLTNSSISPSPSHPTITLDLTNPSGTTAASAPNRFSSSFPSASRSFYSPASFSFSPSEPATWSGGYNLSYGAQPSYYKSYNVHPYAQKAAAPAASPAVPHLAGHNQLTETIAKAITTDPSFQSALAAAITSYVGGNAAAGGGGEGSPAGVGGVMKWGEQLNLASRSAAAVEVAGGNSSQQHGSVGYLQQGLGSSRPKNAPAGSPRDGS